MQMKKLLYLNNRVFWPTTGGHEVEVYNYCRGLHEKYNYSIDLYIFDDATKIDIDNKPAFIDNVYISEKISRGKKMINL